MWRSLPKRITFLLLPGVLLSLLLNPTANNTTAKETAKRIDQLIADLRSDDFEARDTASRLLMELEEAIPALQKARKSSDLEVRRRAADVLRVLYRKRAQRGLSKAKVLGKAGRGVEAADRVAYWSEFDSDGEGWQILMQFAEQVIESTARDFPPYGFWSTPKHPKGDFHQYTKNVHAKEMSQRLANLDEKSDRRAKNENAQDAGKLTVKTPGTFILRGDEISFKSDIHVAGLGIYKGIIAASGNVQVPTAYDSLIIAGGNVEIDSLRRSIIVCDGGVKLLRPPDGGLIIARGKVTCARGKMTKCMVRSGRLLLLPDGRTMDLETDTPDPLAFVKFFELADVGLAAEDLSAREKTNTDGVRLKAVRKESPFAAGLRAGDVITAIEDKKTPTAEVFRRVLRRSLAEGDPLITFTVQRAGKALEVPIPVKD